MSDRMAGRQFRGGRPDELAQPATMVGYEPDGRPVSSMGPIEDRGD
jgi:hypothetical protein